MASNTIPLSETHPSVPGLVKSERVRELVSRSAIPFADRLTICLLVFFLAGATLLAWVNLDWLTAGWEFLFLSTGTVTAVRLLRSTEPPVLGAWFFLSVSLPLFCLLQLFLTHPAYRYATQRATLSWASLVAVAFTGLQVLSSRRVRHLLFSGLLLFGAAACVAEVIQIFGYGHYGTMSTGYPLLSSNYFAELMELLLPVALTRAFRKPNHTMHYAVLSAIFLATVFASGARAGSILASAEVFILFAVEMRGSASLRGRLAAIGVIFALLLAGCIALEGPSLLLKRLHEDDPLVARSEMSRSAIAIFKTHPIFGTGLGTFPVVYPGFATFENGYAINHAHNDWLEFASEGGIVFPACLLGLFIIIAPAAWRSGWGIGILSIGLHALVDFPLHRSGIAATLFLLMAGVWAANRQSAISQNDTPT